MNFRAQFLTLLFLGLLSCSQGEKQDLGNINLFVESGSDWRSEGEWEFENGEITGFADSVTGFLMTNARYSDFELTLEFYPDSLVNSGVYVRCKDPELSATDCYELNIWDRHPKQEYRTGAIVTRSSPLIIVETIGKWNTYRILCTGDHIQAWINEEKVADLFNPDRVEGHIALQAFEAGEIRFRNVVLKVIDMEP